MIPIQKIQSNQISPCKRHAMVAGGISPEAKELSDNATYTTQIQELVRADLKPQYLQAYFKMNAKMVRMEIFVVVAL